ncbi:MAG TPA: ATP-binding protein [Mucilaginibacter sp.]|jgi:signal transduction histidine kinase|nr:ATP-binding protein [Mucilaginibacter sp.]
MKKIVLYLIISAFAGQAFAQQSNLTEAIERQLKEHPQQDTFRVNRIVELLRLTTVSTGRMDSLGHETLSISKRADYEGGEVEGMRMIAYADYSKGDASGAKLLSDQALALAQKITDKTYLADAYSTFAALDNRAGDNKHALEYDLKAEKAAEMTPNKRLIATRQASICNLYLNSIGDYARAMEWAIKEEKTADAINDPYLLARCWLAMGSIYSNIGDQNKALVYFQKSLDANKKLGDKGLEFNLLNRIAERHRLTGRYKEAISSYRAALSKTTTPYDIELVESNMADAYLGLGDSQMAYKYGFKSLHEAQKINDIEGTEWIDGILARTYLERNMPDSAIFYAQTGYTNAVKTSTLEFKRDDSKALANAYVQKKNFADAYKYQGLYVAYRDSMANSEITNKASLLQYNYDLAKKQAQITSLDQERKLQYYFLAGSAVIVLIIGTMGIILLKNNRQKQKANLLLSKQKHEIEDQRDQTNKALAELQQTQTQLVQREKMASLGELTAGIAHEIQNPLNFVNNFSEVNEEMLEELKAESAKPKAERNEVLETELINDLIDNQRKIKHHGKRADFIVKGMLEHSRTSTGERQVTDINVLADEFLKLSYHGLRAKDKSFNSELITNFDHKLPRANVVQQDIGRVLINLFSNAFYAVNEKKKIAKADYKPTVEISTIAENGSILIKVKDNGNGIADGIKDKILQPFFTTKPTGEGTGLGLSLSYDIVVKGHGGKIDVESKEGEGSEFTVILPA